MMKIITGLLPSGVLPRNDAGVSEQKVTGTCRSDRAVSAVVRDDGGKVILHLPDCGHASRSRFAASLDGIPCGGPYSVELSVGCETVTVCDVLVGEVWILAGQSNMQGSCCMSRTPFHRRLNWTVPCCATIVRTASTNSMSTTGMWWAPCKAQAAQTALQSGTRPAHWHTASSLTVARSS